MKKSNKKFNILNLHLISLSVLFLINKSLRVNSLFFVIESQTETFQTTYKIRLIKSIDLVVKKSKSMCITLLLCEINKSQIKIQISKRINKKSMIGQSNINKNLIDAIHKSITINKCLSCLTKKYSKILDISVVTK